MIKLDAVLNTDGSGYWSTVVKPVNIVGFDLVYVNDERDFGELIVCFDDSWIIEEDGLIYTDKRFLAELRILLNAYGLPGDDVEYSEQGMQEYDYVSLECGAKFIDKFFASLPTIIEMV